MEFLPSWTVWPLSWYEVILFSSITLLSLCFVFRKYMDWIVDELLFTKAFIRYRRAAKAERDAGLKCTSQLLERRAQETPSNPFLLYLDQKYTFAETNGKANQVANALHSLGVTRGHTVSMLIKNKPAFVFIHFACLKLAVPLAFLNTNLKSKALLYCIRHTSTKYLIVDQEMMEVVRDISAQLALDGVKILVYGDSSSHMSLTQMSKNCTSEQPNRSARDAVSPNDVCIYIFTSGTTGLPKAVKILYCMNLSTVAYTHFNTMTSNDIIYDPLPLYHRAASAFLNMALYKGIPFAFAPKFSATNFWEDCCKHNATIVHYIGESCRYLLANPPSVWERRHTVRMMMGNGLRKEIWEDFKTRFNIPFIGEGYGSTEGNCVFLNLRNKAGSVGRKAPRLFSTIMNVFCRTPQIVFVTYDVENQELSRGEDGFCVQVLRGEPGLMLSEITALNQFYGYINGIETNKKVIRNVLKEGDAYFNTGDMMLWDTDYYLYFVDRVGDTFRWKGENVSTQEVGNLIGDLDIVQDCSIYGVSIPGMDGKCGMGAIVLKPGCLPTTDVLQNIYNHCGRYLPSYARPVFIRFMEEIHLTSTFKHQKYNLQREGFDINVIKGVYIHDVKHQTYARLTAEIHENILNGNARI